MERGRSLSMVFYLCFLASLGLVFAVLLVPRFFQEGQLWEGWRRLGGPLAGENSGLLFQETGDGIIPICKVQGTGFASPYDGRLVRIRGVVYADLDQTAHKGFFIQEANCDRKSATSDGIFVFLGKRLDLVSPGDVVEVRGRVQEYYGETEIVVDPENLLVRASSYPLPAPAELSPPFPEAEARAYFESHEGMYVAVEDGRVVGPTNRFGETWILRTDLNLLRVFANDSRGKGEIITVGSEGVHRIEPGAKVGDRVLGVAGALAFTDGGFQVWLLSQPSLVSVERYEWSKPKLLDDQDRFLPPFMGFEIATFNLHNLFDTFDDPGREDPLPSAAAYRRQLRKLAVAIQDQLGAPDLVGVQEVENGQVLDDLLAQPEVRTEYGYVWQDGPDIRGIDVGLLYRRDRVRVLGFKLEQGCTVLADGLGPDGNRDMNNPRNQITCDTDGDGHLDGNRLFSRPPLVVHVELCNQGCSGPPGLPNEPVLDLWLVVVHFKSKSQDTTRREYTLPRRVEQARFLDGLGHGIVQRWPGANVILLGDFNDYEFSEPLEALAQNGFKNLIPRVPRESRYSYIYQGVSQVLDHILISPGLVDDQAVLRPVHINSDFPASLETADASPYRSSDHDPLLASFMMLPLKYYLPFGQNGP